MIQEPSDELLIDLHAKALWWSGKPAKCFGGHECDKYFMHAVTTPKLSLTLHPAQSDLARCPISLAGASKPSLAGASKPSLAPDCSSQSPSSLKLPSLPLALFNS